MLSDSKSFMNILSKTTNDHIGLPHERLTSSLLLEEDGAQLPMYYISHSMITTKMKYYDIVKIVFVFFSFF